MSPPGYQNTSPNHLNFLNGVQIVMTSELWHLRCPDGSHARIFHPSSSSSNGRGGSLRTTHPPFGRGMVHDESDRPAFWPPTPTAGWTRCEVSTCFFLALFWDFRGHLGRKRTWWGFLQLGQTIG
ncbi:hypothetical protein CDAR_27801 [Caerostris darwini]|uniref:Uncharacterized protein n=1 Tax=Caerostris darwini TaxID=1538125 RepID=A0AAV4STE9_9ARAC|nr:hypothetical protein CDAR_27801 [Caerostris darwini]